MWILERTHQTRCLQTKTTASDVQTLEAYEYLVDAQNALVQWLNGVPGYVRISPNALMRDWDSTACCGTITRDWIKIKAVKA